MGLSYDSKCKTFNSWLLWMGSYWRAWGKDEKFVKGLKVWSISDFNYLQNLTIINEFVTLIIKSWRSVKNRCFHRVCKVYNFPKYTCSTNKRVLELSDIVQPMIKILNWKIKAFFYSMWTSTKIIKYS